MMLKTELTIYLPDGSGGEVPMEFRLIPACLEGFLMGSRGYLDDEEPRHRVVIPWPFYLGAYPVTQAQFACYWPEHTSGFSGKTGFWSGGSEHPAENLSWHDAQGFLEWLNNSGKLPDVLDARLPFEAEWEYACRAGTDTEYWNGDGNAALREVGWFDGNAKGSTHAVGELERPNPWGLHDLHGNVWEWCEDKYGQSAYIERRDGWLAHSWQTSEFHPERVMKGGSWRETAMECRSAFRLKSHPDDRYRWRGFRVLLSLPAPDEHGRAEPTCELSAGAGADEVGLGPLQKPRHHSA